MYLSPVSDFEGVFPLRCEPTRTAKVMSPAGDADEPHGDKHESGGSGTVVEFLVSSNMTSL
jgi:hypothetical protein